MRKSISILCLVLFAFVASAADNPNVYIGVKDFRAQSTPNAMVQVRGIDLGLGDTYFVMPETWNLRTTASGDLTLSNVFPGGYAIMIETLRGKTNFAILVTNYSGTLNARDIIIATTNAEYARWAYSREQSDLRYVHPTNSASSGQTIYASGQDTYWGNPVAGDGTGTWYVTNSYYVTNWTVITNVYNSTNSYSVTNSYSLTNAYSVTNLTQATNNYYLTNTYNQTNAYSLTNAYNTTNSFYTTNVYFSTNLYYQTNTFNFTNTISGIQSNSYYETGVIASNAWNISSTTGTGLTNLQGTVANLQTISAANATLASDGSKAATNAMNFAGSATAALSNEVAVLQAKGGVGTISCTYEPTNFVLYVTNGMSQRVFATNDINVTNVVGSGVLSLDIFAGSAPRLVTVPTNCPPVQTNGWEISGSYWSRWVTNHGMVSFANYGTELTNTTWGGTAW